MFSFQKYDDRRRCSPRIKASLSHAALETLKRSGLRRPSGHNNQENSHVTPTAVGIDQSRSRAAMGVPKILVPASARKTQSASALRNPSVMSSSSAVANAKRGGALVRQVEEENVNKHCSLKGGHKRRPLTVKSGNVAQKGRERGRTRSWGQLTASAVHEGVDENCPRYMTRSRAKKISKSMSDLVMV